MSFYGKYPTSSGGGSVVTGDLTDVGTDGIVITGGTGAVVGTGTSLAQHVADSTHNGYLSSTDWSTFNSKQATVSFTTFGSTPSANGGGISAGVITLQPADGSNPGGVSTTTQTLAGDKTFSGAIKSGNYHIEPSEFDAGNSSTAQTINWANGSAQKSTLTGNVTYTLTNPVTGGAYVLKIATGAGSFTATWPAAVKWPAGTAPTITATAGRVDLINLYWDGTDYFGTFAQNYTP